MLKQENILRNIKHVNFAITNRCNAKCQHCSINAEYNTCSSSECLSTKDIIRVINKLDKAGISLLGLTGGEAILHDDIESILKYCNDINMFVAIATNGIDMSYDKIEKLKKYKVKSILISIDDIDSKKHDSFRGVDGCHEKAIDAIKKCVTLGMSTTIGFTPMKYNYELLPEIIKLGNELGVNAINISSFVPTGRGKQDIDLSPQQWRDFYTLCRKFEMDLANKMRIQYHDPRLAITSKHSESLFRYFGRCGCLAGQSHCYILPNGDVHPCVMLPVKIGNILKDDLNDIINQNLNILDRDKLSGECAICTYKYRCGGCRAAALSYHGDALAEDPRCWIRKGDDK